MKRLLAYAGVYTLGVVSVPVALVFLVNRHAKKHPDIPSSQSWQRTKATIRKDLDEMIEALTDEDPPSPA